LGFRKNSRGSFPTNPRVSAQTPESFAINSWVYGHVNAEFSQKLQLPSAVVKHEINNMLDEESAKQVQKLDFTVGGDHGVGRFRFALIFIIRFETGPKKRQVFSAPEEQRGDNYSAGKL